MSVDERIRVKEHFFTDMELNTNFLLCFIHKRDCTFTEGLVLDFVTDLDIRHFDFFFRLLNGNLNCRSCTDMNDPWNTKLHEGCRGTVVAVDDIGTIHIFGVLKPNGYRQFNTAYIEIPKKQGKSELAAAVACTYINFIFFSSTIFNS